MKKRVVITGGTGFIGAALCAELDTAGYELVVLSRGEGAEGGGMRRVRWDARSPRGWVHEVDGAFAVVNLAGDNIGSGRWTAGKKRAIRESRIEAGMAVTAAVSAAKAKPKIVLQASATGWYGNRGDERLAEDSARGDGFLPSVAREWEDSTAEVEDYGVRRVVVRTGVVLGRGGMLERAALPFRLFAGGIPGGGRPWFSWIHLRDAVRAIRFLMERKDARGVYNLTSPGPVRAAEFYRSLGGALHRPVWLPVPAFALRVAFGEMARELMLSGQRVLPERLLGAGFGFEYPDLEQALAEIFGG
ncbi:MAG: TIGR01777 family oxidoreductase [Spirochaetes bacterium]|nr:TIGR01777 family oxidoreductase [Spirochaetota bacterium]